jgi:hypothetical protein
LALLLLWLKNKPVVSYYYVTLGITTVCLILAGHMGAEVTHGKGFLLAPLLKGNQNIVIENADSAIVFRDVIQPILNEKCLNCHNANRAKNDLILSGYAGIMKGGKSSDAVVPGNADESLLYKYIVLPMNDSLHMPPKEKLQLDQEEIKLIGWWINTGAVADQKYFTFPKVDSIDKIMLTKFRPKTGLDLLDVPFADPDEIASLNNPYRTVQQISATRPYVAVFLGTKRDFSSNDLTELKGIREQVVSLDLGNSSVTDDDLRHLKQFPHLQKLFLQNVNIGDNSVTHLKDLKYLEVLNLSGTKISSRTLDEISGWSNVKKLYIYNTSVPEQSVTSLKSSKPELQVLNTHFDLSDSVYNAQLTLPVAKIDSTFFRRQASVEVKLSRGKVKYFYTLDGSEPTDKSNEYRGPFNVDETAELKIKATMTGWTDSNVATFPLLKLGVIPERIILETKPHPKHPAKLDTIFVDGKWGGLDRGEKEYIGFVGKDCHLFLQFDKIQTLSQVTLSFLEDPGQGVFAPEMMEVWGGEDANSLTKLGSLETEVSDKESPASKRILKIQFPQQKVKCVRVIARNIKTLPPWHPLKKTDKPAMFIDEVSMTE